MQISICMNTFKEWKVIYTAVKIVVCPRNEMFETHYVFGGIWDREVTIWNNLNLSGDAI